LREERARNVELSARVNGPVLRGDVTVYQNRIQDYIYAARTGQQVNGLRVFQHQHTDARFRGLEGSLRAEINPVVTLSARHDRVFGTDLAAGEPLPLVPPARSAVGLEMRPQIKRVRQAMFDAELEYTHAKSRLSALDTPEGAAAHTLLDLDVGGTTSLFHRDARLEFGIRNVLNIRYRNFLSRYKEFADEPGTNLVFRIAVE
jgi:iron complex outermembrane receptor protein